jgi:dTDP-4-amino-4,6-dideoxygalactose transaminase
LPAYYGFSVRCPAREQLQQFLLERGIQTCVHYPVAPQGPKPYGEWAVRRMPITERLLREVLSLPIGPLMTDDQVRRIVKALNEFNADL